ncbi:MAG: class I SAM-dependent methyltransferase, partial [Campylobacterota bacterium]|nr:class I SAM-dependent methyltransferase [Campylobacterota bacterium]
MIELYYSLVDRLKGMHSHEILEFEIKQIDKDELDYKTWVDLSQVLYCKMLTPIFYDDKIVMRYKKLNQENSFHSVNNNIEDKYGENSNFSKIDKNNQTSFIVHYLKALENVKLDTRLKILNLGINSGGEFEVIKNISKNFKNLHLVGIDYCSSAIKKAKEKFDDENITFLEGDINHLEKLNLEKYDLIISIGTLQSSSIDFNKAFMNIVQNYLKKDGAMILGFPNCRWIDEQMIYGAKAKNYNFSEMSVLYKDVNFCKKYLQQKKFRVTVTGKDYIFLTA